MFKKFEGMAIEKVLQEIEEMGVEYEYEAETEDTVGSLIIGSYWGGGYDMEIEDGHICTGSDYFYWD